MLAIITDRKVMELIMDIILSVVGAVISIVVVIVAIKLSLKMYDSEAGKTLRSEVNLLVATQRKSQAKRYGKSNLTPEQQANLDELYAMLDTDEEEKPTSTNQQEVPF